MLDLIERRMGILDILDEQCRFPRVNIFLLQFFCICFIIPFYFSIIVLARRTSAACLEFKTSYSTVDGVKFSSQWTLIGGCSSCYHEKTSSSLFLSTCFTLTSCFEENHRALSTSVYFIQCASSSSSFSQLCFRSFTHIMSILSQDHCPLQKTIYSNTSVSGSVSVP